MKMYGIGVASQKIRLKKNENAFLYTGRSIIKYYLLVQ
jgi:hypothetical protein